MNQHPLQQRMIRLGLYGAAARFSEFANQPWIEEFLAAEEKSRLLRGVERRVKSASVGRFRPMSDFDWNHVPDLNRLEVESLFSFDFIAESKNIIMIGSNGVGKTMLAQNLVHDAARAGHRSLFTDAARMINDLESRPTSSVLERCLKRYTQPRLLAIDEVGFLSFQPRGADLFFQVIKERYEKSATIITTNRELKDWGEIFPNRALAGAILDRLIHHSKIFVVDSDSYRLLESRQADEKQVKPKKAIRARRSPAPGEGWGEDEAPLAAK